MAKTHDHTPQSPASQSLPAPVHESRLRARYAETDQMGIVYYSNYLVWMEIGRTEYCRSLGIPYREMERQDRILLAVAEAHCRYLAPAFYDDEIIVRTWIEQASSRLLTFGYEIQCATDGRKLASGYTKHIYCDTQLRATRLPQKYWKVFGVIR
ncbi:MAG: acyl-CoA thioesterase [Bryobacteraceae bacterium]|nr:acyl-CoA thioesterase [Bryobacteraceae bacterium]MDW8378428.1 thioesterase family protein [Bryobacterales bacterium]